MNANPNGVILPITGSISLISSITIIIMILRSRVRLSSTYHRLMLGISIIDITLSCGMGFSSLPAPIGTPGAWKALGTQSTCDAQGFFIMFGVAASPVYFTCLQLYYLCKIKYQTSREKMKKVEPYLHAVPILVGSIVALIPLVTDSINPGTRGYCWLQDFPLDCAIDESIECIRGSGMRIQRLYLLLVPFGVISSINIITMWMIYASVRRQDSRYASHDLACCTHSPEEIHRAQYAKSRKARIRIMQYFLAYFLTFFFPIVDMILHDVQSIDNLLQILFMIFYPLWGFFNLVVFIIPEVNRVQERNAEFSLPRAFITAITSYLRHTKESDINATQCIESDEE